VLVAGPNLTIDRTLTIEELRPGEVLRFESVAVTPGGKGVNVARAARALGVPALLVGFTPGRTGAAAAELLADEGIALRAVPAGGELRSTAVVFERSGRTTVMNEPGPPVGAADWRRYETAVREGLGDHGVLVCSGSLPPGAPDDAYARLARLAAEGGAVCMVDTSGAALAAALEAMPDVVLPNLAEAERLLRGRSDEAVEAGNPEEMRARAGAAAVELVRRGARAAVVTAGAAGAASAVSGEASRPEDAAPTGREPAVGEPAAGGGAAGGGPPRDAPGPAVAWHPAPVVTVRNPIGAGDAFAGGLAARLERGEPLADAVPAAVAIAAASVEAPTAGDLDPGRAAELGRS
jgi:1-phosphofructokinase family hexose kinase